MKILYDAEVDALYIEFKPLEPGTADNRELSKVVVEVSPIQHAAVK